MDLVQCDYCKKTIMKKNLERHHESISCRNKQTGQVKLSYKELEIKYTISQTKLDMYISLYGELKEEIKEDKKTIIHLASKPTMTHTTTNNTFNQLTILDLSQDRIKQAVEAYNEDHYLQGADGTVEWLNSELITDEKGNSMYVCNDKSREFYYYKNEKGEREDDTKCKKLIKKIKPVLGPKVLDIRKKRHEKITDDYGNDDDNTIWEKKTKENKELAKAAFEISKSMM